MKKEYTTPTIEMITFEEEDILNNSSLQLFEDDLDENNGEVGGDISDILQN